MLTILTFNELQGPNPVELVQQRLLLSTRITSVISQVEDFGFLGMFDSGFPLCPNSKLCPRPGKRATKSQQSSRGEMISPVKPSQKAWGTSAIARRNSTGDKIQPWRTAIGFQITLRFVLIDHWNELRYSYWES